MIVQVPVKEARFGAIYVMPADNRARKISYIRIHVLTDVALRFDPPIVHISTKNPHRVIDVEELGLRRHVQGGGEFRVEEIEQAVRYYNSKILLLPGITFPCNAAADIRAGYYYRFNAMLLQRN